MKTDDLLKNHVFLKEGAGLYGDRWIITPRTRFNFEKKEPVKTDVTALIERLIKSGKVTVEKNHPNAIKNCGWPVKTAKFNSKCGYFFLISPNCHGNGGWSGQTIHRGAKKLAELLDLCPNEHGWGRDHGPYAHDPEPRICTEPEVNRSIIVWDSEELVWKHRNKEGKVLAQFGSRTTYSKVS